MIKYSLLWPLNVFSTPRHSVRYVEFCICVFVFLQIPNTLLHFNYIHYSHQCKIITVIFLSLTSDIICLPSTSTPFSPSGAPIWSKVVLQGGTYKLLFQLTTGKTRKLVGPESAKVVKENLHLRHTKTKLKYKHRWTRCVQIFISRHVTAGVS